MVDQLASISLLLEKRSSSCKRLINTSSNVMENNKDFYDDYIQTLDNFVGRVEEFIVADTDLKAPGEIAFIESMLNSITLMARDYSLVQQEFISSKNASVEIIESYQQVELILKECIQFLYSLVEQRQDELSIVTLEELNKIMFILALDI